jgi:hypothetical protein
MPYDIIAERDIESRHYTDGGFQNYQTTFGITMQTSCNDKVPSSTDINR